MKTTSKTLLLAAALAAPSALNAQVAPPPFHAPHLFDTPTSRTVAGGDLQFEIAHRFTNAISTDDAFLGLDGGAWYRIGLDWGITDRIQLGIVRSNVTDNTGIHAKARVARGTSAGLTWGIAVAGGHAWNTEVFATEDTETGQIHAALVLDVGIGDRVALGASPSWVDNPDVLVDGEDALLALPIRAQVFVADGLSLFGEWTATEGAGLLEHDPVAAGIQIETRGHFFTIGVTNSERLNPAQYFTGAEDPFSMDEIRLAFNIIRRIRL